MFRAHVFIIRRSKLYYTASGIITPVHETATYRCDDTLDCIIQFWPPYDEQICSKHVEAWNKLIVKQKLCASSWLITEINILRCTVSKTSKVLNMLWWHLEDVQLEEEVGTGGFKMGIRKVARKVFVCGTKSCQKIGIQISGLNFLVLFLLRWLVCFCLVAWLVD